MKKLISLSAVFLMSAVVFAQDTIPPAKKNTDSIPVIVKNNETGLDTIPKTMKDTSLLSQSNKFPDTSMNTSMNRNTQDTVPSNKEQAKANSQTDSTSQTTAISDRVVMKDDKVMVVKKGDSTLLEDSIKLESGAIVKKDGSVTYTSGKNAQLKNGQYIALSNPVENNAAADSTATATATTTAKATDEDKVVMVGDKVMVVKSGDSTVLQDTIKLKSGAIVKSDATVKFKDGTSTTLKNGQYIALNPPPPPPAENKSQTTDAASTTATAATTAKPEVEDKVVMKDDQVVVIKNGDSTVLTDSIKLNSGAVVKKDGSVVFKNGSTTKLKNGQFIAINAVPAAEGKKSKKAAPKKKIKSNG